MSRYGGMVARVCLTAAVCSAVSMPVAGQCVVYVDANAPDPGENPAGATWKTAFATLEEGLQKVRDDAEYPCQIKVADGTYKPTARRKARIFPCSDPLLPHRADSPPSN